MNLNLPLVCEHAYRTCAVRGSVRECCRCTPNARWTLVRTYAPMMCARTLQIILEIGENLGLCGSAGERYVNSQPWAARRGESNARGLALIPVNSTGALAHGPRTLGSMLSGCPRNGPPVRFRCPAQVQVGSGCTAGRCVRAGLGPGSLMRTLTSLRHPLWCFS